MEPWGGAEAPLCSLALALLLTSQCSALQDLSVSQITANAPSISSPGALPGLEAISVQHVAGSARDVRATVNLFLRNDGTMDLNTLCVAQVFAGEDGRPGDVSVHLVRAGQDIAGVLKDGVTCFVVQQAWKPSESRSFDLMLATTSRQIPLHGFVSLTARQKYQELMLIDAAKTAKRPARQNGTHARGVPSVNPSTGLSTASSKPLTRAILLLPPLDSRWFIAPIEAALAVALGVFLILSLLLHRSLTVTVGGPQWNVGTSFATNFTVGTGLASLLLGSNFMIDALHYMTKLQYGILGALFAAVLLLGPTIFSFFGEPQETTSQAGLVTTVFFAEGWLLVVVAALMTGAVIGQLFTVGLAVAELQFRGAVGVSVAFGMEGILGLGAIGTVICALRTVKACLASQPGGEIEQHTQSLQGKLPPLIQSQAQAGGGAIDEAVMSEAMDALNTAAEQRRPERRALWRMF